MKTVAKYEYKSEDGKTIGVVHRLHNESSDKPSKSFVPHFNINDKGELTKGIPESVKGNIPLYGLGSVTDKTQSIYIVEGEKCAAALHGLGLQTLTSQGGSNAIHSTDWTSLKGCESVYIIPDNDDAGEKYAESVYRKIKTFNKGANIQVIKLPYNKKGDDICDVIVEEFSSLAWDELSPLRDFENATEIKEHIRELFKEHVQGIPIEWNMIYTKKHLPAIALSDFQKMPIPKREAYLAPWLTSQSISMVFAPRGLGKTFYSLSCGIAVAEGKDVMGYKASQSVPVLYLDGEMQSPLLQERFELLRNGDASNIPFHIVTPDLLNGRIMPDLSSTEGQTDIDELIEKLGIKVLFIDNLSTLVRSGKENEGESWLPIQTWLVSLRSKGLAIVVVHHSNKNGEQRGTSRKEDIMDNVIALKQPDDYEEDQGARFTVEYTKARALSGNENKAFEVHLIKKDGKSNWVVSPIASKKERAIEMRRMNIPTKEVANALGVDVSTVYKYCKGVDLKKKDTKPKTPFTQECPV